MSATTLTPAAIDFLALVKSKDTTVQDILDVEHTEGSNTYFLLAQYEDGCRNVVAVSVINPNLTIVHPETELRNVRREKTRGNTAEHIWPSKEFGSRVTSQACEQHVSVAWRAQL